METKRRIITLSIILVALVILYILGSIFSPEKIGKRGAGRPLFDAADAALVDSAVLTSNDGEVLLEKNSEERWSVEIGGSLYPADAKKIDELITSILELTQNEIISTSRGEWDRLNIGDDAREIVLKGKNGSTKAHIFVGAREIQGGGEFIRLNGEDTVYLSDLSFSFYLNKDTAYWSDLDLYPGISIRDESISLVSVKADLPPANEGSGGVSANYTIAKSVGVDGADQWEALSSSVPLNQQAVQGVVRSLASLKGDRFVPGFDPKAAGFDNPKAVVRFTADGNRNFELTLGNRLEDGTYYLKSGAAPDVYSISSRSVNRIIKNLEELKIAE